MTPPFLNNSNVYVLKLIFLFTRGLFGTRFTTSQSSTFGPVLMDITVHVAVFFFLSTRPRPARSPNRIDALRSG